MLPTKPVYLLLGSNLGDRLSELQAATDCISDRVGAVTGLSSIYETAPWGVLDQPAYLNQVLEVQTAWSPVEVLTIVLEIEQELGRVRRERWGARVIDIDLLFYADQVLDDARLTVPHPRLHERRFTLIPLVELIPSYVHPVLGKNLQDLLKDCVDSSDVYVFSGNNSINS